MIGEVKIGLNLSKQAACIALRDVFQALAGCLRQIRGVSLFDSNALSFYNCRLFYEELWIVLDTSFRCFGVLRTEESRSNSER